MPTENNKDARGPSGLTESELLAWYESLISAGKARGIALDETHPMVPGQFVVCDTNGETLTDAIKARALGEENTPDTGMQQHKETIRVQRQEDEAQWILKKLPLKTLTQWKNIGKACKPYALTEGSAQAG